MELISAAPLGREAPSSALTRERNGYARERERWILDWEQVNTPLGLPSMRQAVCTRTSFVPLREELKPGDPRVHFYATDLAPHRAGPERLSAMIREHWGIENRLHQPKDRTWLEDRHWVGNKRTGAAVTMLHSLACCLVRKARIKGVSRKAYSPERIELFNQCPHEAVELLKARARL